MWFKRRRNEYGCPMCGKLIDYLDDGWKIINVTAANPLALDNNEAVVLYVIERTTANHWSKRNE